MVLRTIYLSLHKISQPTIVNVNHLCLHWHVETKCFLLHGILNALNVHSCVSLNMYCMYCVCDIRSIETIFYSFLEPGRDFLLHSLVVDMTVCKLLYHE